MNLANHIRHTGRVAGFFKNGISEIPFSISLAVTGISIQMYASYNLITSGNGIRLKIPYISQGKDTSSV